MTSTTNITVNGEALDIEEARDWLLDCMGSWHDIDGGLEEEIQALSAPEVAAAIARHYTGGISQFVRDDPQN